MEKGFTGQLGDISAAGVATYLVIDGGTLYNGQTSGQGSPTGSPCVMVDFGSTAGTVYMYDSASTSLRTYTPPVNVKGTGITLYHTGGSLGIASLTGETATLTAGTVNRGSGGVSPNLYLGSGVTQTLLNANAGTIFSRTGATAANTVVSGTAIYTVEGTGAHTALNCYDGGKVNYGCTGTIGTLNLTGEFNNESYSQPFTITDRAFGKGAKYFINNGKSTSITQTNAYSLMAGTALQDIDFRLPVGKSL